MHPRTLWPALLLTSSLASSAGGCGTKGGGEGESTSGATSTSGSTGATGSSGSTATSGADACEGFLDAAEVGPAVEVRIENHRDVAIFLEAGPACTAEPRLELLGPGGEGLHFRELVCDATCADHFTGECACAADCGLAPVIRIEAGGAYSYTWPGALLVPVTAPAECVAEGCSPSCEQRQQAGAGAYTFRSAAGVGAAPCVEMPELCACTPGADGWCELFGLEGVVLEGLAEVEAGFSYPAETMVALVVE